MRKLMLCSSMFLLLSFDTGDKYLSKVPGYEKETYFKQTVYAEKSWRDFYSMKEPQQLVDPKNYDIHLLNAALFFVTNKLREEKGLKQFLFSDGLRNAATIHTSQMVEKNFFDHFNRKDKKLYSPEQRMQLFIPKLEFTGENCAENYFDTGESFTYIQLAEKIVKDLYASPPHKRALLEKGYKYLGCGVMFSNVDSKNGVIIKATQDFSSNI